MFIQLILCFSLALILERCTDATRNGSKRNAYNALELEEAGQVSLHLLDPHLQLCDLLVLWIRMVDVGFGCSLFWEGW